VTKDEVYTSFRLPSGNATLMCDTGNEGGEMATAPRDPLIAEVRTRATESHPRDIRIMVVDDHPAVRWGLVSLLGEQTGFSVAAVSVDAEGALAEAQAEPIDVAVLDYSLGGHNGLWVCRRLKRLSEPPRVIVFSAFANDHLAACCVVAEADAVLNKAALGSELCDTIRAVARGRRRLPKVPRPMADMLRRRLDEQEQMIFGMLLAGIPRSEIERTLSISARELSSRADSMLRTLELLPGEPASPRVHSRRTDFERLIPQYRRDCTTTGL
jgi:DNA-binding NarL/FixJ family response regulator